jgi:hypothetical protein
VTKNERIAELERRVAELEARAMTRAIKDSSSTTDAQTNIGPWHVCPRCGSAHAGIYYCWKTVPSGATTVGGVQ